jgi:transcriptional regulator with XRE-family HTH domain
MEALTYGRRSLLALLQRTTAREVAARCRVAPSCVSEWQSGIKRPCRRARAMLATVYGISAESWAKAERGGRVPLRASTGTAA